MLLVWEDAQETLFMFVCQWDVAELTLSLLLVSRTLVLGSPQAT